ncbi:MAG: hypothetical protein KDA47_19960, partial [Planctomycetales bacterium]|nr:hypothetical protein [Planctomycetales bacterium]
MSLPRFTKSFCAGVAIVLAGWSGGAVWAQGPFGDPSDFLRRMDQNRNGMLDPDEMQGPARFMIDRMARDNPRIDPSKPISIDMMSREFERMRQERFGGGPPGGSNDNSRGGSSRGGASSTTDDSLVPGFDVVMEYPLVPGFGAGGELFTVKAEDEDRKEAQERIQRYDRNRDGVLTREEIAGGRWSDDPFQYDRNGDGKLSESELAVRYARRRIDRNGGDSRGGDSRGGDSNQFVYSPTGAT